MAAKMPTYITLKDVKKRWGQGQEDIFPVTQFEKLRQSEVRLARSGGMDRYSFGGGFEPFHKRFACPVIIAGGVASQIPALDDLVGKWSASAWIGGLLNRGQGDGVGVQKSLRGLI